MQIVLLIIKVIIIIKLISNSLLLLNVINIYYHQLSIITIKNIL